MRESEIGPYRILERLGQGGMGEVYLADDPRLGRRVAVKTISGTALEVPEARERLVREARAAARLNHPNIAAIYDIVEGDGSTHVVMEFVDGENLAVRLLRGPLRPDDVAALGVQLASALFAAHSEGIVHRDLKPANVQLTRSGSVKVLDFGLAKSGTSGITRLDEVAERIDTALTQPGQILGTPAYMAPEQLRGQPADARSDIYSLGVLLFELLTGQKPYDAPDFVGLALEVFSGQVAGAHRTNPAVPEELSRIVGRAMARQPEMRYPTAKDLQDDLERFLAQGLDLPTRSVLVPRTEPVYGLSHRLTRPAVLAVLLVLIGGMGGAAWMSARGLGGRDAAGPGAPAGIPVVAVLPLANASGDPANDHLGLGIAAALTSHLAALPQVTLVSRSSILETGTLEAGAVARELGAAYVVTGTVQRSGETLKVSVRLLRADESVAWGYNYEGPLSDVFVLQRELAQGVSRALQLRLSEGDRRRLAEQRTTSAEAFSLYAQARLLLERPDVPGNVERSIRLFKAALEADPRFALAHAGLGQAHWQHHQRTRDPAAADEARRSILEALRLDPADPGIRVALGVLLGRTGRAREAVEELARAVEERPQSDEAHRHLAEALARVGEDVRAVTEAEAAIAARPTYWANHRSLGLIHFDAGRYADALGPLRRATELQPDSAWGYQTLGVALQALGRNEEALGQYQRANELSPDAMTLSNIGALQHARGEFEQAVASYRQSLALEPSLAATHRNLGDALQRLGQRKAAREAYARAVALLREELRINPGDPARTARLASYQAKAGQTASALGTAQAAVALRPEDPTVLYHAAVAHALAGRNDEAARLLDKALTHGYSKVLAEEDEDLAGVRKLLARR